MSIALFNFQKKIIVYYHTIVQCTVLCIIVSFNLLATNGTLEGGLVLFLAILRQGDLQSLGLLLELGEGGSGPLSLLGSGLLLGSLLGSLLLSGFLLRGDPSLLTRR